MRTERALISWIVVRYLAGSAGNHHGQGYQSNDDSQMQPSGYVEASIEPSEATLNPGERVNLTCLVKGAQQYTITWNKYAHDTSLPSYARVCDEMRKHIDQDRCRSVFVCLHE
jgi:hypothetical protein